MTEHKEILALFILTCLFFSPIIIHYDEMIYPPGNVVGNDVTAQYSFWRSFFASSITTGEGIPFWNPFVFSGTPFAGNPLSSLFYPLTWLFVLFNSELLFGWLFFIDVFLIGLFTFIFARTINLSKPASLLSAIVFMFSGTIILRIYAGHLSNIDAIVWFPLALIFCERSFTHSRYITGIGAGISLALMFLSGNVQFALYGASATMIYFAGRTMIEGSLPNLAQKCRHIAVILLICLGICCVISAVQLLPTLEYAQLSNRAGGLSFDFSSSHSLPPSYLITALVPDAFGNPLTSPVDFSAVYWELCFYVGILPLLLAIVAIMFNRKPLTYLFASIALLALLYSLGRYFPLYSIVYQSIPGFSLLRIPTSVLFITTFSLAILAGLGWDAIFQDPPIGQNQFMRFFTRPSIRAVTHITALFLAILIVLILLTSQVSSEYFSAILLLYALGTVLFCILPSLKNATNPFWHHSGNMIKIIIIFLLVIDLFAFGMRFIDTKSPSAVFEDPAYIPAIVNETDTYYRVYDETDFLNQHQTIAFKNNVSLISGYDPTYLKDYQSYFTRSQDVNYTGYYWWMQGAVITDFDILRSLNVRYIITSRHYDTDFAVPGLQCVYNNDSVRVYRLNITAPRAYLIPSAEFTNNTPVSLQPAFIERYSPNAIDVNITTTVPGYLVLSEIWYPGWSARDNNEPIAIERYKGIFRAVYLDPGQHRVSFTYFPKILSF